MKYPKICSAILIFSAWEARSAEPAAGVEFFEKKIRPVLVEHCAKCHSAEARQAGKLKGGLLVDSRDGLRKGGDSGPAIVPGQPAVSLLLKAMRYQDESMKMPPKAKLSDGVLADFERWIATGAPDPRTGGPGATRRDLEAAKNHWAFQPIRAARIPEVKNKPWVRAPIDAFVLAKLEAQGLTPSQEANRRTLIRRVTYDLIGLPPTWEEVREFEQDREPNAWERVVDRLLASPHYGERWGRHWLDVARYADTKDGVLMYGDDRVRPYAYTYRDYVIRAFNEDLPFDRFVREQLAADQIEPPVEPWRLGAMGFLTLGRMFDGNIHDVLDDRIDTVSRGMLGLTVSCARCHDHKYDPIPIADYYSLYGVFASSEQPLIPPLIDKPNGNPAQAEFDKKFGPKQQEVEQMLESQFTLLSETARQRVGDYLVHVVSTKPDPLETAIFFLSLAPEDLRPQIVARWRAYLDQRARPDDPVFGPWHDLLALADADFAKGAPKVLQRWKSADVAGVTVNPLVVTALSSAALHGKADVARTYGDLLKRVYNEAKGKSSSRPAVEEKARQQLLDVLTSHDSPAYFPKTQTRRYMSRGDTDAFGNKVQELDRIAVQAANAPARAMVLNDMPEPYDPKIFIRGNPSRQGDRVPRQFLWIVEGERRKAFPHNGGRLDLARAITADDNPLTSRVLANRVWMHHFGEPLVDTPSDFGIRSSPPSHPELLDYLATTLRRNGWSLKKLHRTIVLSSTYQQASFDRADCRRIDPDNRLLWRANRRRLDLEAMRDSLLAQAGRLDRKVGGRPVDLGADPLHRRRTVYSLVDRQSLPGLFRAFDFASPDQSAERRPRTTVPQQALFGMNATFVLEQAKALMARPEVGAEADPAKRVDAVYRIVLSRPPDANETRMALAFIAAAGKSWEAAKRSGLDPWQQLGQVLLLTNETMFVD